MNKCDQCGDTKTFLYISGMSGKMVCQKCKDKENGKAADFSKIYHQLDNLAITADYITEPKIQQYVFDAVERIRKLLKEE
jgi:TATA-box binding protein (TBP) (component of TFIID and TFIIIB)